jgi:hypothetical protein
MESAVTKSFDNPDQTKTPPKTNATTVKLGDTSITKLQLEPGWKRSECVKPVVGGDSCQVGHVRVVTRGSIHVVQDDGIEVTASAGEAYYFGPGHNGWIGGDETFIGYEF